VDQFGEAIRKVKNVFPGGGKTFNKGEQVRPGLAFQLGTTFEKDSRAKNADLKT